MGFPSIVRGYRAGVFSLALALGSAGVWADTIVLKNGHRISASNVVEVGDKIRYETSVGELSLPKSIVDHIEKGGGGPRWQHRQRITLRIWPSLRRPWMRRAATAEKLSAR